MKLNNIWGYGQLFGYSALDGANRYYNDFVGTLMTEKICIRFELAQWVKIRFAVEGEVEFRAVTGDMIDAKLDGGEFFLTFADADTLVGYSPVLPTFESVKELRNMQSWGTDIVCSDTDSFGVRYKEGKGGYKFCIHHSATPTEARSGANYFIDADVEKLKKERYAYYEKMPKCKNEKYERLYYKALAINKVNTHTAEGKIPCMWTTPDRVPHRHMWLWDSVFHALAMVTYNPEAGKNAIRAVLAQMRDDGFIAHMMNPTDCSDVTQPTVLAFGVWSVYQKTGDKAFLKECAPALSGYLSWDMQNRDKNGNGLLEWFTEPEYTGCRCGESGLDNSPRFDFDEDMDAIDFSTFLANDARYLSLIYEEIDDNENAKKWQSIHERVKSQINTLLWDDEVGVYCDRLFSGEFTKFISPSSFLPLFAGLASKEQAERMVKVLTDKNLIWTEAPLASVAKNHPTYSTDMWRGGVWLNINYFIAVGLKKYGYGELSNELLQKSLEMVNKWYEVTGTIFEFYDPENKTVPFQCERKGKPINPPDWRRRVHSISDYNWSACFTILMIQNELYGVK